jgi:hypothetical protein
MITFQKHIELQRIIESGGNIEVLFSGLDDIAAHCLADDI